MRLIGILLLLGSSLSGFGQNLVPNPSFESYTSCPDFASQLERAEPWVNPNIGTPEYYNTCATWASYVSLPAMATGGFQEPRTGDGFAGIYVFRTDVSNMREYVQVPLTQPLEAGKCYSVSFHVNAPNDHALISDGVGALLTVGEVSANNAQALNYTPQVQYDGGLISDTLGWVRVQGHITANGGEDHLTIGNFKTDAQTSSQLFNPGVWYAVSSYLYIDDVSVEELPFEVALGNDTSICVGEELALDASTGASTYVWNTGQTDSIHAVSNPGTYSVEARLDGCVARDTVDVVINPLPWVEISGPGEFCKDEPVELVAEYGGVDSVYWSNGASGQTIEVVSGGVYTAEAANHCGAQEATKTIEEVECFCEVYMPSAFTPNNDALNEHYGPVSECRFLDYSFSIFNRWGQELFQSGNPDEKWDGKLKGKAVSQGVYRWQLSYKVIKDGRQQSKLQQGIVRLVR